MFNKIKNNAFTLAEVLIVVAIIGAVTAITIPNLNKDIDEASTVARVKKANSVLNNAFGVARAKYGESISLWLKLNPTANPNTLITERIIENMNVKINCGKASGRGCFANRNVMTLDGTSIYAPSLDNDTNLYKVVLDDGMSIAFSNTGGASIYIYVDVDGLSSGQNKLGRDIFTFKLSNGANINQIEPEGLMEMTGVGGRKLNDACYNTGDACAYWVFRVGNMDYLRCYDLDIVSKRTCR